MLARVFLIYGHALKKGIQQALVSGLVTTSHFIHGTDQDSNAALNAER